MTFNINYGIGADGELDIKRIAKVIKLADVDVVALQRVDRGTVRSNEVDQVVALDDLTGMTYAFGKIREIDKGETGNALLTRFPILEERLIRRSGAESEDLGSAMVLVLDVNGQEVLLANTDVEDDLSDAGLESHLDHLRTSVLKYETVAAFLCGHFGTKAAGFLLQNARVEFLDAWAQVGKGEGFTYPAGSPKERHDHIFIVRKIREPDVSTQRIGLFLQNARTIHTNSSDHLPLLVEVKLKSD